MDPWIFESLANVLWWGPLMSDWSPLILNWNHLILKSPGREFFDPWLRSFVLYLRSIVPKMRSFSSCLKSFNPWLRSFDPRLSHLYPWLYPWIKSYEIKRFQKHFHLMLSKPALKQTNNQTQMLIQLFGALLSFLILY